MMIYLSVVLDLVVQRPKHRRDGFLLSGLWHANRNWIDEVAIQRRLRAA